MPLETKCIGRAYSTVSEEFSEEAGKVPIPKEMDTLGEESPMKTRSEMILDLLADGLTYKEIRETYGFDKQDLISAALFGVTELRKEYRQILRARPGIKKA